MKTLKSSLLFCFLLFLLQGFAVSVPASAAQKHTTREAITTSNTTQLQTTVISFADNMDALDLADDDDVLDSNGKELFIFGSLLLISFLFNSRVTQLLATSKRAVHSLLFLSSRSFLQIFRL